MDRNWGNNSNLIVSLMGDQVLSTVDNEAFIPIWARGQHSISIRALLVDSLSSF